MKRLPASRCPISSWTGAFLIDQARCPAQTNNAGCSGLFTHGTDSVYLPETCVQWLVPRIAPAASCRLAN